MREIQDGDFPFGNDFNSLAQSLADTAAVVSGCGVDDGGTTDMAVDVASGTARVNASDTSVAAQSVTLTAADASNDRYDLVVVDGTGTASSVTGTASTSPAAPSIPADRALLAIVYVQAGASGVSNADINDARAVQSIYSDFNSHAGNAAAHHARPTPGDGLSESNGAFNVTMGWEYIQTDSIVVADTDGWVTVTVPGSYDDYYVIMRVNSATNITSSDLVSLRVDGGSTDHEYVTENGFYNTNTSNIRFLDPRVGAAKRIEFTFDGTWDSANDTKWGIHMVKGTSGADTMQSGAHPTVASPLGSFDLDVQSGTLDASIEWYGRNA